jgi:hypothetical protein
MLKLLRLRYIRARSIGQHQPSPSCTCHKLYAHPENVAASLGTPLHLKPTHKNMLQQLRSGCAWLCRCVPSQARLIVGTALQKGSGHPIATVPTRRHEPSSPTRAPLQRIWREWLRNTTVCSAPRDQCTELTTTWTSRCVPSTNTDTIVTLHNPDLSMCSYTTAAEYQSRMARAKLTFGDIRNSRCFAWLHNPIKRSVKQS